jgi:hypothetical protein
MVLKVKPGKRFKSSADADIDHSARTPQRNHRVPPAHGKKGATAVPYRRSPE